mmetsp:Transcript_93899/g.268902  ORF Transcript_93899/g.268902 Transcript_93899/m.268902 type:complete len:111 (-) Transcript_93899:940-1272(-)
MVEEPACEYDDHYLKQAEAEQVHESGAFVLHTRRLQNVKDIVLNRLDGGGLLGGSHAYANKKHAPHPGGRAGEAMMESVKSVKLLGPAGLAGRVVGLCVTRTGTASCTNS